MQKIRNLKYMMSGRQCEQADHVNRNRSFRIRLKQKLGIQGKANETTIPPQDENSKTVKALVGNQS